MRAIVDTNLLISGWRPERAEELAISVASTAELQYGVIRAGTTGPAAAVDLPRRLKRLAEVESEFDPIPVNAAIAREYAHCAGSLQAIGRNPRSRVWDLIIAATAITTESRLYTLNPADFHGLAHLLEIVRPDGLATLTSGV